MRESSGDTETLHVPEDHGVIEEINRILTWLIAEEALRRHVTPAYYRAEIRAAGGWAPWAARILELDGKVVTVDTYDGRAVQVRFLTQVALDKAGTNITWAQNLMRTTRRRRHKARH